MSCGSAGTCATSWQSNAMPISLGCRPFCLRRLDGAVVVAGAIADAVARRIEGRKRHQHDIGIENGASAARADRAETGIDEGRTVRQLAKDDRLLVEDGRHAKPGTALGKRAISGLISTSERIGKKPETIVPSAKPTASPAWSAIARLLEARFSAGMASRADSRSLRNCAFNSLEVIGSAGSERFTRA